MRNRCWHKTTAWVAVLERPIRESGQQITADNGQNLATAARAIHPIKQNN
jgi:hypothetical protein